MRYTNRRLLHFTSSLVHNLGLRICHTS